MARVREHETLSSAAQPACVLNGDEQPALLRDNVEQASFTQLPDDTSEMTVGFYNVGIQLDDVGRKNWRRKEAALKQDIIHAFLWHELDMLCLSELGEIDGRLDSKLNKTATDWIKDLLADIAICSATRNSTITPCSLRIICWKSSGRGGTTGGRG